MSKKSVIAIVHNHDQAELAVENLRAAGFSNDDISALFPDQRTGRDFAHEKHTKAPEGAATGGATGGVIGGALGWLVGIGALAIPGVGPFIAAGPIMAALGGAAIGGAVGGVAGALIGFGMPEFEARRYEGMIRDGNILISVHVETGDEASRAKNILKLAGATDIAETGETAPPKPVQAEDVDSPSSRRAGPRSSSQSQPR
jgi:hypothetical protein